MAKDSALSNKNWRRSSTCILTAIYCTLVLPGLGIIGKVSASTPFTNSERAVLDGISSGDGTDLGRLSDRSISGDFLSRLIAGEIPGAKFRHNGIQLKNALVDGDIDISGQDVHVPFTCEHCEFVGHVDLSDVHFFHNLSFARSAFDQNVNMDHAVADGDLDLRDVQFDGEVDFSALQVSGSLYVGGAHVNSDGEQATFDHIKVAIVAEFTNLELNGPLTLEEADLNQLHIGRDIALCHFSSQDSSAQSPSDPCKEIRTAPSIDLEGATVHREFALLGQDVENLYASDLTVEGRAILQGLTIDSSADLRGAHFRYLVLSDDLCWPNRDSSADARIQLDGISFSQIELQDHRNFDNSSSQYYVASDDAYTKMVQAWPENAGYSPRPFQQLEKAFADAGRSDLADLAFESMKDKERESGHLSLGQHAVSWVLSWLIRYGREPHRALYTSIVILLVGWFIFRRREFVDPKDPKDKDQRFSPFWYSLDLFLPLSTLPDADIWTPKEGDHFRSIYARVHSLLGWILIPIGLAAISGLVPGK